MSIFKYNFYIKIIHQNKIKELYNSAMNTSYLYHRPDTARLIEDFDTQYKDLCNYLNIGYIYYEDNRTFIYKTKERIYVCISFYPYNKIYSDRWYDFWNKLGSINKQCIIGFNNYSILLN
jgi:hypothetical protein